MVGRLDQVSGGPLHHPLYRNRTYLIIIDIMSEQYYRGHNKHHAAFWVGFRELPPEKRFAAFIKFYREVEEAVREERCTLRDAGYALEPGDYNEAILAGSQGGDMIIALGLASELANWVFESRQEAEEDWEQIVLIMEKYS